MRTIWKAAVVGGLGLVLSMPGVSGVQRGGAGVRAGDPDRAAQRAVLGGMSGGR